MDNKCLNCSSPGIYKKKEKSNVAISMNWQKIVKMIEKVERIK